MNTDQYDKSKRYPIGHGYELRVKPVSSIVVHSTSNSIKNTLFASEAKFLYEAPLVSAHYLIGKDGTVIRFLDPKLFVAWHAGNCLPGFNNSKSVGAELHHSVGDPPYPAPQLDALAALLRSLMALFNVPVAQIETHGQIALPGPYDRKKDPSDMSRADFLAFRARVDAEAPSPPPDLFSQWGAIGKPMGAAQTFAVPQAWLANKKLGKCVTSETYGASGLYSVAAFEFGIIIFLKGRKTTIVEMY